MIKIELINGNLDIRITENPNVEQVTHMLMNAQLHVMREIVKQAPVAKQEEVKALIFDLVNLKMSAVLESFAPEYELRPNLTTEAIIKAENELLKDEMSKVQKQSS